MAASKALNPRAPAYTPLSYATTHQTPFIPPLARHIHHLPLLSPPPPPQPSFYPTASQPPLLHPQPPLYATSHPTDPPPPPAVEPTPVVPSRSQPRAVTRGPRGSTSGFRSSKGHQKVHNFGRGFNGSYNKFGNTSGSGDRSSGCRYVDKRTGSVLRKHERLPLLHYEERTTVMIKNIPKLYNGELLLKFLDEHCLLENQKRNENREEDQDNTVSAYDFMYLPIDFRTGCSRGFAFVNFTEARAAWKFFKACDDKCWDLFHSPKIREIVSAKIQGKEALVKHFERSRFHCESDEFLPVCFNPPRDGSGSELVEETRIGRRISLQHPKRISNQQSCNAIC